MGTTIVIVVSIINLLLEYYIRLAFSIIWKMTPEGKPIETWYGRTIIRPCAKLSYEDAQEVIDGRPLNTEVKIFNDHEIYEIEADIKLLHVS